MIDATKSFFPVRSVMMYAPCAGPMPSGGPYCSGYAGVFSRTLPACHAPNAPASSASTRTSRRLVGLRPSTGSKRAAHGTLVPVSGVGMSRPILTVTGVFGDSASTSTVTVSVPSPSAVQPPD